MTTPTTPPAGMTAGRTVEIAANSVYHEFGIDFTDGVRVTVGWSEEDDAWIARVTGCAHDSACLADGPTKEAALLNLACAMAATLDAVEDDRAQAVASLAAAQKLEAAVEAWYNGDDSALAEHRNGPKMAEAFYEIPAARSRTGGKDHA